MKAARVAFVLLQILTEFCKSRSLAALIVPLGLFATFASHQVRHLSQAQESYGYCADFDGTCERGFLWLLGKREAAQ